MPPPGEEEEEDPQFLAAMESRIMAAIKSVENRLEGIEQRLDSILAEVQHSEDDEDYEPSGSEEDESEAIETEDDDDDDYSSGSAGLTSSGS